MKKALLIIINFLLITTFCSCDSKLENNNSTKSLYIEATKNFPEEYEDYSVLNKYETDLNSDGVNDTVTLYTDAEKIDGEIYFNDGNTFSLIVADGSDGGCYELFNDYVQLGNVHFQVADYFKDGKALPVITVYESTGAVLKIMNFSFESEKGFLKEKIYDSSEKSDSGINLKYSTIPSM